MIKKILSIVVALAVLFAICACNGNSDLLQRIQDLEATVQSQADKIAELEKQIEDMSKENDNNEENNGIWFNAHTFKGRTFDKRPVDDLEVKRGVFELVTSLEELQELCDKYNNTAFIEGTSGYTSEIGKKIKEYDEAYFSDKSLIVFETEAGSGATDYSIKKIYLEDEMLIVNIWAQHRNGLTETVRWTFLIEVKKTDVDGIEDIKYEFTNEYNNE